jgi:beta-galactosidase/beta-glucuronidase
MLSKKFVCFTLIICLVQAGAVHAQQNSWKIAGDKITTPWADKVNPAAPLPEYPRPQMRRENAWVNLNGLWQYSILPTSTESAPSTFDGSILVPFAVESALSGVGKTVGKDSILWYKRTVTIPKSFRNKRVLLHFGAVDWRAEVFVNGKNTGKHEGGYDPFSFDVTDALKKSGAQEIVVKVWDPSDQGPQPRGKQVRRPNGIWYTPVTGIWQTVWLEAVPETYIVSTKQVGNLDNKTVTISVNAEKLNPSDKIKVTALDGTSAVAEQTGSVGEELSLSIPNGKAWSTQTPFLYGLNISIERNGKIIDQVKSYFGLRKISMAPDSKGIQRMMLNDRFVFQFGPLDQGWWPDGLYTAPTDEALRFDIEKTKEMGFNMIRKHVKVEPARWYYYCDSIGILVWQDMPSGDLGARWERRLGLELPDPDMKRSPESEKIYRTEWNEIMTDLHNFPSIVVWVPFNEAWGQFKTAEIVNWTMKQDPTRLVNTASGGNFHDVGHILDIHNYPMPIMPRADLFGKDRIIVLGEYGGLGLPLTDHTWQQRNWGYQTFGTSDSLLMRYAGFIMTLDTLIQKGLSAAVYTQTTDVEGETNGLMTYDRKIFKIPVAKLKELHDRLYKVSPQAFYYRKEFLSLPERRPVLVQP